MELWQGQTAQRSCRHPNSTNAHTVASMLEISQIKFQSVKSFKLKFNKIKKRQSTAQLHCNRLLISDQTPRVPSTTKQTIIIYCTKLHTSSYFISTYIQALLLFIINMLQCVDQIEVSINERLDHLTILLIDSEQLASLVKDEEKKRNLVKNFRIIKSAEKARIANEQRYLKYLEKHGSNLSKSEVIACENMLANCINQYLNTDYEAKKAGEITDLVDIFIFYYHHINARAKAAQLTVIKNCQLFTETNFIQENIAFFLQNMHQSISHVYETEKNRFFNLTKSENRSLSPQRKEEEEEQKFDATGKVSTKDKRKLQLYCFELSKLLDLESIYLNYFYFNSLDSEKRKRALVSNFLKRNVHVKRIMSVFETEYRWFRERQKK